VNSFDGLGTNTFVVAMVALKQQKDYFAGFLFAMQNFVSTFCFSSDCVNSERGVQTICAFLLDFSN
jgi:ABC-type branched-subunit amino acid transport system permease subunit